MMSDCSKPEMEQKKKTRRTKKDGDGRDFACPCGKSYLSYPALYTHVKTKHGGKPPRVQNPQKEQMVDEIHEDKNYLLLMKDELQRYFETLEKINLNSFFPQLEDDEENEMKQLVKDWQNRKNQYPEGYTLVSIDFIFGRFFSQMKGKISPEISTFLQKFICSLRRGIAKIKNSPNYCKQSFAIHLPSFLNPLLSNELILFPYASSESHLGSYRILVLKILYFFTNWLYQQNYTNSNVKFNPI